MAVTEATAEGQVTSAARDTGAWAGPPTEDTAQAAMAQVTNKAQVTRRVPRSAWELDVAGKTAHQN